MTEKCCKISSSKQVSILVKYKNYNKGKQTSIYIYSYTKGKEKQGPISLYT